MKQDKGIIYGFAAALINCFIFTMIFDNFGIGLAVGVGVGMMFSHIGFNDSNESSEEGKE